MALTPLSAARRTGMSSRRMGWGVPAESRSPSATCSRAAIPVYVFVIPCVNREVYERRCSLPLDPRDPAIGPGGDARLSVQRT